MIRTFLQTTAAVSLGALALMPVATFAQSDAAACVPSATVTCPDGPTTSLPGQESTDGTDDSTAGVPADQGSTGGGVTGNSDYDPAVPGSEKADGTDDSEAGTPEQGSEAGGLVVEGRDPLVPGAEQPDGTDDSDAGVPQ